MATERQLRANPANAIRSTGPISVQGQSISSKNALTNVLASNTIVLKGESMRRFNDLASAVILQFQPRNCAETFLVQTMTAARWRFPRMWGIQTAGFELEMGPPTIHAAVLAALTFQTLAHKLPSSIRSNIASKPLSNASSIRL